MNIRNLITRDRIITATVLIVLFGAVYALGTVDALDRTPDRYHEVCQDEFGAEYEYAGAIPSNPPAVSCNGPDGGQAIMDMPEWMAEEHGWTATAYNNESD